MILPNPLFLRHAGLDNVQSMGAEISAEAGPATDADAPASGTSEGVRTASERVRTASEGVSADPQGVRTAPEGVRKASEDVRTALDDVCTGTEEISSDPRAVRTGPEGVEPASESGRTSLEGVRTTPEGVRTTLDGVRMRPLTAKAEELRTVLEEAVEAALPADCIILSGGLDTCVLAELAAAGAGNGMDGNGMDTSETGANGISAVTEGGSKAKQEQREHGENSEDPLKRSEEHRRAEVRIHIQQPISDSTARPASISAPPANSGSVTDQSGSYDNRPEHMDVSSAYAADRQTTGDISREGEKQSADMAPRIKEALTVLTGEHATDRPYAEEIAKRCGLRHTVVSGKNSCSTYSHRPWVPEFRRCNGANQETSRRGTLTCILPNQLGICQAPTKEGVGGSSFNKGCCVESKRLQDSWEKGIP